MMIREIADRRSIRKYKPDEISTEALNKMIQSGRLAPSGKNKQPWKCFPYNAGAGGGKNYKWRERKNGCGRDCLTE